MTDEKVALDIPKIKSEFKVISLDLLDDPAKPMRTDLSPESVEDLVISIRQVGVIEPLVVKPVGKRFEIIAGHRRLVAAGIASLAEVPCYVVKADSQLTEMLKVHENIFRSEISPIDESKFYDWLVQHYKLTPGKIAGMISKSQGYVMDRLEILEYHPEIRQAMLDNKIKFTIAKELHRVTDVNVMRRYLFYAIRSGLTQALARQWVDDWKRTLAPAGEQNTTVNQNPVIMEEYITYVNCIYCKQQAKLFDALAVYIHPKCHDEVAKFEPTVVETPTAT
jgi:ParB/RepB/Spo0J family partition protein